MVFPFQVTSYDRNVAVNMWFKSHSALLERIYQAWFAKLPQTIWGKQMELKIAREIASGRDEVNEEDEEDGEHEVWDADEDDENQEEFLRDDL